MQGRRLAPQRLGRTLAPTLALAAVVACQDISRAPEGTPRLEAAVSVRIEDAFYEPLDPAIDRAELEEEVREIVQDLADLGMRFYPVPIEQYDDGGRRPPYRIDVRLRELETVLENELVEDERPDPFIRTRVEELVATVSAEVRKRTEDGPSLLVARATRTGDEDASALEPGERARTVQLAAESEGEPLRVRRDEILAAVRDALRRALSELQDGVDRELETY